MESERKRILRKLRERSAKLQSEDATCCETYAGMLLEQLAQEIEREGAGREG